MPDKPIKILLVEDNPGDARLIREALSEADPNHFQIVNSERLDSALKAVRHEDFDIVLLDLSLPDSSGLHTFEEMHAQAPWVPVVVLTGLDIESFATEAVQQGAQDYLIKGQVDSPILVRCIRYAIERERVARELRWAYAEVQRAKDTLEVRVQQRTRDLEDANQRLLEAQDQLVHSERMAIIGKLAGGIAHDLNNPLGAIKNANYYLKRKLIGTQIVQFDPRIAQYMDIIGDAVDKSASIISDLIGFAFLGAPQLESTDLVEVIEGAVSSINLPENIFLVKELQPNLGSILADREQLFRVFANLGNNGLEAMPYGGQLRIGTGRVDGFIEVCFQDGGLGITEENLQLLFEPLFTTKNKGTGLGLSICQRIISNHGGSIEVTSKPDHGSTFKVKLPVAGRQCTTPGSLL